MMKHSFEDVCVFVADVLSVDRSSLTLSTTMSQLGVDGDDADEFMQEFSKRFAVDLSDFRFADYFGSEASALLPLLPFAWIYRLVRHKGKSRFKPLHLADLHSAAINGRWGLPHEPGQ